MIGCYQKTRNFTEILIEDNKMSSEPDKITNQLIIDESTITEDICDFINENSINDICNSNEELNEAIRKIEEMRSKYRSKHKELQLNLSENYEAKFSKVYQNTMSLRIFLCWVCTGYLWWHILLNLYLLLRRRLGLGFSQQSKVLSTKT